MPIDPDVQVLIDSLEARITTLEQSPPPFLGGNWKTPIPTTHIFSHLTETDVMGLGLNIPVNSVTDRFVVTLQTSAYPNNALQSLFVGRLFVDGQPEPEQHIFDHVGLCATSSRNSFRLPVMSLWVVDGFSSTGLKMFKIMGKVVGSTNTIVFSHTHSRLNVWRIL